MLEEQCLLDDSVGLLEFFSQQVVEYYQLVLEIVCQLYVLCQVSVDELIQFIIESMYLFLMLYGVFVIEVVFDECYFIVDGVDYIEFCVIINFGQLLQLIVKVVFGGELLCIVLVIQVIIVCKMEILVLIFDEVDVGISGLIVVVVGKLLCQLGEFMQVMCVIYLLQVVGCGYYYFFVCKEIDGEMIEIYMQLLDKCVCLQELVCLLGGSEVMCNILVNVKELFVV